MKPDIKSREDIQTLVNLFYQRLVNIESMQIFFKDLDWEHHLPRMVNFWDFIIFSTPDAYKGSLMPVHERVHLFKPMSENDFKVWLSTFNQCVDELFEGPNATIAKESAFQIGSTIQYKLLGSNKKANFTVTKIV